MKQEPRIKGGATLWARQTVDSEIFEKKPAVWFKIWFYLVNRVHFEDFKELKRGECFLRYEWIMEKTGASKSETDHCLRWLKSATMLATRKATHGLIVKVLKYDFFQTLDNYYGDIKSDSSGDSKATQKRHKSDNILKNDKKEKNEDKLITNTVAAKPPRELTPTQKLIEHFFHLKGWGDRKEINKIFPRFIRSAQQVLDLCEGDLDRGKETLEIISRWANAKELDWSIETVMKKWFELDQLPTQVEKTKKAYIGRDRAYQKNGDWFVILPNGEHKQWIGSKQEVRYE